MIKLTSIDRLQFRTVCWTQSPIKYHFQKQSKPQYLTRPKQFDYQILSRKILSKCSNSFSHHLVCAQLTPWRSVPLTWQSRMIRWASSNPSKNTARPRLTYHAIFKFRYQYQFQFSMLVSILEIYIMYFNIFQINEN